MKHEIRINEYYLTTDNLIVVCIEDDVGFDLIGMRMYEFRVIYPKKEYPVSYLIEKRNVDDWIKKKLSKDEIVFELI